MRIKGWLAGMAALAVAGCSATEATGPEGAGPAAAIVAAGGGFYTMTNGAANEVVHFRRGPDGSLEPAGTYGTGGAGTGAGLGSQGAVALSADGRWLLVVNAASSDVSVFRRGTDGALDLVDRTASGGTAPVSVTQRGPWVFVLNEGGDGNIAGFRLAADGTLSPTGTRPLSQAGGVDAAQISFSPDGRSLVVTEKNTDRIVVYAVRGGQADAPVVHASAGPTPFGFAFSNDGVLVVSNAAGGAAGAGSASSYAIGPDGALNTIAAQVANFQAAPCWFAITRNGKFAYTTNTATDNTTGYRITPDGGLELLHSDGVTASNSGTPIDVAINPSGSEFVHVLNAGTGTIEVFRVGTDGSLTFAADVTGLPTGTNGLAAY